MKKIQSIRNLYQSQKGQSLVETAIIAPILIFMLIGVFEVGWALRGYLVLTNVNRETTRFGVRPGYLNYSAWPPAGLTTAEKQEWVGENVGYYNMIDHMFNSLSNQLDTTNVISPAVIISHLTIDTGWPCDPEENDSKGKKKTAPTMSTCDCNKFDRNHKDYDPNYGFTKDDQILHPGLPAYKDFYAYTYDPDPTDSITYTTQYTPYATLAKQLIDENNLLNCRLLKRSPSATPTPNYVILTETWYRQLQLFGFPLISNPFTDPVPMYAHTMMRIPPSRSGKDEEGCMAYPFVIKKSVIDAGPSPSTVDILGGNGPNDFGWLAWNPTKANDSNYLAEELRYPELAINDFYDNHDDAFGTDVDRVLSVGDWVASLPGTNATIESSDGLLTALIGQRIRIPVWDGFETENVGTFSSSHYHISGFIWVRIESSAGFNNWTATSDPKIFATYLGDASDGCAGSD